MWSSLSFSLVFVGEIGKHIRLSLSLSLSLSLLRRERFGKPDLPIEYSAAHAERAIIIFEKEEIDSSDKFARESRKKKRWIGFLLIAAQEHSSHRAVASKTKTHTSENKSVRVCYLPSAPAGHASKIHSSVALIYVCVCVCIFCVKISL